MQHLLLSFPRGVPVEFSFESLGRGKAPWPGPPRAGTGRLSHGARRRARPGAQLEAAENVEHNFLFLLILQRGK